MEFAQIKRRVRGKSSSFWWLSAILQSGLILEKFEEYFLSKFMYIVPVAQIDSKNILRMFSKISPDPRIVLTPPERA